KVGTSRQGATDLADLLVEADYRGHYSHGLNRLETYIEDVTSGACQPNVQPTVLKETLSTAWVDGNDGLGVVVGNFCMELAMSKARQTGVGWVVAKRSNHYGIAGWYSIKAVQCGLLKGYILKKCTRIYVEEEWKPIWRISLSTSDRDSSPDHPVIGSLVYCEIDALIKLCAHRSG
ncbi:unnamed protein product, partial [Timema podura]|nr:unnamed protein product [Timema podura]